MYFLIKAHPNCSRERIITYFRPREGVDHRSEGELRGSDTKPI